MGKECKYADYTDVKKKKVGTKKNDVVEIQGLEAY